MSEKPYGEDFWELVKNDIGGRIGSEMIVFVAGRSTGKTSFTSDMMIQYAKDHNLPVGYIDLEVFHDKPRDYNGPQYEFDFEQKLKDD